MFYVQHGFGKSTKLDEVVDAGDTEGVILSPAHEDPSSLAGTSDRLRTRGVQVLVDPQSFVYSLNPQGSGRHHGAHGLDLDDLHWAPTTATINNHLGAVESVNRACGTAELMIAPSPLQTSLMDYWMPTAIQYARSASDFWGTERTLASVVIDENVLTDWSHIQEWLDVLTTLRVRGFYLLVNRNRAAYPPAAWNTHGLTNLLRIIYTLTDLNEYELHWGYSDFDGLLGLTVGATSAASGWSYGHRQFSTARWNEVRKGGAPAIPRVTMAKLLAAIRNNEAEDIESTDVWREVTTRAVRDSFDGRTFDSLKAPEAQVQHLVSLSRQASLVAGVVGVEARLEMLELRVQRALEGFEKVEREGVSLDPRYRGRVRSYRDALASFREAESL